MKRFKKLFFVFTVLFLSFTITPSMNTTGASNAEMNIYSIYLGADDNQAGDAVLVESGGQYLLMDLGPVKAYPNVKNFLKQIGVTELSLYISHMHADHTGGLSDNEGYDQLLKEFHVKHVYVPDKSIGNGLDLSWNYGKIVSLYEENYKDADADRDITYLKQGSVFSFGGVNVNVIGPVGMENKTVSDFMAEAGGNRDESENIYLNNCSLVSILTCGNTKFFTGGDIDTYEENKLVQTYGAGLKADIYKMSHHGYANSNTQELIDMIRPVYTFAPNSGAANGFTSASGTNQRKVYSALDRCSQYGFVYLTGAEKVSAAFKTFQDTTKIYRTSNMSQPLSGYIEVEGADGRNVTKDHYLLGPDGKPLTGVQHVEGKTYYFGTGGRQEYGLYRNGTYNPWRSYMENGTKKYRYYEKATHEMKTGLVKQSKDKIYYCDPETGFRTYGFVQIKNKTYYFGNAGTMYKNKWLTYKKRRYYFQKNGVMACNGWIKVNGTKFYFNEDGSRGKGLTKIGKKYYYLDASGTEKKKNFSVKIDGVNLIFDSKGVLQNVPTSQKPVLKSVSGQGDTISVKWKKVSKASGYAVYTSENAKKGFTEQADVKKSKSSALIKNLAPGTYYVRVMSYRKIGGIKFYSKPSSVKKIDIQ